MHLFLTENMVDNADLSFITGTELYQFPLSNIQNQFTQKICRVDANTCSILIDTKNINVKNIVCLTGSSLDGLGFTSISIYHSATTDFSSSTEIIIDLSSTYNFGFKEFTDTNNRYFKLVFTGTGSYTEISKIFLGESSSINNRGFSKSSFKYAYQDISEINNNKYGNRFSTHFCQLISLSGNFKVLGVSDVSILETIISTQGMIKPFFVILDRNDTLGTDYKFKFSGYFYFQSLPEFQMLSVDYYTSTINLIQAG